MGAAGCVPGRPCRRWSARGPNPEPTDKVRRSAAPGILPARMPHVDAQKARTRRGWGGGLPGLAWPRSSSWPGAVRARCVAVAGDLTLTRRRGVSWCADRQPAFPGTAGPPRWQIGRLAVLAATAARAIRLSEAAGLMPGPARSAGGYRLCGPADLATLIRIRRPRGLGFEIGQIRALRRPGEPADLGAARAVLREDLLRRVAALRAAIEVLDGLRAEVMAGGRAVYDALAPALQAALAQAQTRRTRRWRCGCGSGWRRWTMTRGGPPCSGGSGGCATCRRRRAARWSSSPPSSPGFCPASLCPTAWPMRCCRPCCRGPGSARRSWP